MKKLICFLFLGILILTLFYNRNFDDFEGEVNYVFEDYENGIVIRSWDNGESVSQSMKIDISDIDDFIEYFDVEIVSDYYIDDMKVINGYSKYLPSCVPYKNGYVNLQIAISDIVLVGYPQLYQGF